MLGIIGGSGFYNIELTNVEKIGVKTPFGTPSAVLQVGHHGKEKVAFLPRHGDKHQLLPSEINYRANIWALKSIGVRRVISVSAVGSLQQDIEPGNLVLPSQYIDWTRGNRERTFFGNGTVAHIASAEPTCNALRSHIALICDHYKIKIHQDTTYLCIEGPRFSTRAESLLFKSFGADLVGMTNVPEVFLAQEAQLCYCTIGIVTDYDSWLDDKEQHVTVANAMGLYKENLFKVKKILQFVLQDTVGSKPCKCQRSLDSAVLMQQRPQRGLF